MKIFCDGYTLIKGGGYTVVNELGQLIASGVSEREITNNEAELNGIVRAIEVSECGGTVSSDSLACIGWVKRGKTATRPDLKSLIMRGQDLMIEKGVSLIWESREVNLAGKWNERMQKKLKRERIRIKRGLLPEKLKPEVIKEVIKKEVIKKDRPKISSFVKNYSYRKVREIVETPEVLETWKKIAQEVLEFDRTI